jgi:hypothetical protein
LKTNNNLDIDETEINRLLVEAKRRKK